MQVAEQHSPQLSARICLLSPQHPSNCLAVCGMLPSLLSVTTTLACTYPAYLPILKSITKDLS